MVEHWKDLKTLYDVLEDDFQLTCVSDDFVYNLFLNTLVFSLFLF